MLAFEEPYAALRDVTAQGHINAMLDTDGILRHHMLKLRLPDGTEYPSMALALAQMYHDFYDLGPVALPPVDARNFWYVPFCGEPGDFDESISVADLISGEISADYFAGKIVFIGPYTIGLQDNYITSIDHARQMYGVEFQANAVQALLWGEYKREAGDGLQLSLLFGGLLLGLLGFWRRRVRTIKAPTSPCRSFSKSWEATRRSGRVPAVYGDVPGGLGTSCALDSHRNHCAFRRLSGGELHPGGGGAAAGDEHL